MISKDDAVWLLKRAMQYGMTYTDGVYKNNRQVTMNDSGYWVIPINGGSGFCIEHRYESVFSWIGSPDELKEVSNGL
jgi:hypothetical protein